MIRTIFAEQFTFTLTEQLGDFVIKIRNSISGSDVPVSTAARQRHN